MGSAWREVPGRGYLQVLDAARVERRAAAQHAVHDVALHQQQLGQVAAILAGDACDEVG